MAVHGEEILEPPTASSHAPISTSPDSFNLMLLLVSCIAMITMASVIVNFSFAHQNRTSMVSYPRQNSNFSFVIHLFKFDIQVFVICLQLFPFYTRLFFHSTSSILYTNFCILYTTFSIQLFTFYIQLFVLATFYIQPQSNKKQTAGSLYQPLTEVPRALQFRRHFFLSFIFTYFYSLLRIKI